jgi:hypothetical protein
VYGTVDVGVVVFVEVAFGVDDLLGFLCCGGVVEVDEGVIVDFRFRIGKSARTLWGSNMFTFSLPQS